MYYFSKKQKLLSKQSYKQVFDNAEIKISRKYFLILARRNKQENAKIGIIISKKNIKHAVNRNRCKRLVRESFRMNQDKIKGLDFIFLARKGLDCLKNKEFYSEIDSQWNTVISRINPHIFYK
ncbi:MAG: ribonuclease P protein component [Endozoicomonadaceae bacterium]|nr:ribonuclease P protein component [Endozoicomonadaceae bacterium]